MLVIDRYLSGAALNLHHRLECSRLGVGHVRLGREDDYSRPAHSERARHVSLRLR
jgi:hypothetical protein